MREMREIIEVGKKNCFGKMDKKKFKGKIYIIYIKKARKLSVVKLGRKRKKERKGKHTGKKTNSGYVQRIAKQYFI